MFLKKLLNIKSIHPYKFKLLKLFSKIFSLKGEIISNTPGGEGQMLPIFSFIHATINSGQTMEMPQGLSERKKNSQGDPQNSHSVLWGARDLLLRKISRKPQAFQMFVRLWVSCTSQGCRPRGCMVKH